MTESRRVEKGAESSREMGWKQGGGDVFCEVEPETPGPSKEEPSLKQQLKRAAVLLPLLACCWLLLKGWQSMTSPEEGSGESEQDIGNAEAKKDASERVDRPLLGPPLNSLAYFKEQIVEQLGGKDRVEVRHLALSDDGVRLVAALRVSKEGQDAVLTERFFERDEFGRFLSVKADGEPPLILWSESSRVSLD